LINLRHQLVINSDVSIRAFAQAPINGRHDGTGDEFIITRTGSRSPSLAVNREMAEFLLAFSAPCPLLIAVQLISGRTAIPPDAVLEEIYPHLRTFLERGILVRIGNPRRKAGKQTIRAWSLERKINDFDDSAVFLVKNEAGQFGALKLVRTEALAEMLERERRVLEIAGGELVPAVLDHGSSPLGSYLVTEWQWGSVAIDAFRELRTSPNSERELRRLAFTVVEAFERLHERGIIRGDIQPKNIVIDLQGGAWIIDFSHSAIPDFPSPSWRMGVPFFFEPEYARALLEDPPRTLPLSLSGENYAVAAMLYYLLLGVHSIEFSIERETMLRQIAEAEPRHLVEFINNGRWEQVDEAIHPLLAKEPEHRPASLAKLRDSLEPFPSSETEIAAPAGNRAPRIHRESSPEQTIKKNFGLESDRLRKFDVVPPLCSLTYGAAGIAYTLLRAAELCEDAELLWAADAWIERAEAHIRDPEAFTSPRIDLTRRRIGYSSLASSEPGLFFVKSLIRAAEGDLRCTQTAVLQFLSATAFRPSHDADLNLGGVGLSLAADRLHRLPLSRELRLKMRDLRDQTIARAWLKLPPGPNDHGRLGFAHGTAGMIFSALTNGSCQLANDAAQRLRALPIMIRKGIHWPVRAGGDYFMPGWCNSVAGHLLMWTRVWQCSGLSEDREMMERAAWGVLESRTSMGNLCCGAAGQAVALASFASATGEPLWRNRASELLNRLRPTWPKDDHPQSLFRGELGLLLASLECDSGVPSRFPVWGASLIDQRN
jgi:serine/threonine protein kinase